MGASLADAPPPVSKETQQAPKPDELWHLSLNDSASETIVLLHGLGSSHDEWMLVWPHLTGYHLLVPDLPGHSNSAHLAPASIPAQAAQVVALIRDHAHGGTAHVVGLSMGGFVALETARTQPELARCVFATGCAPFAGWRLGAARHTGLLGALRTGFDMLPVRLCDWVSDTAWAAQGMVVPDELRRELKRNSSAELLKEVFSSIVLLEAEALQDVKVRTLAVAGGKGDDVEATRRQGALLEQGCEESKAVVVQQAVHPWDLQLPEVFAGGITAWIEGRALPEEYEDLSQK
ncbi:Lipase 3 [Tolypocladium ophioglossoides CBS 100239]|uniref:Lipase 3 n=1 Tax=Tolypocladium ophioglossoides (strain CBS 100239) TaxID=1163406 RepID=A0A0L0NF40_TOLOC|nr:Lipase 3 [Tolypocladium ophioglossoides CBS 100239]